MTTTRTTTSTATSVAAHPRTPTPSLTPTLGRRLRDGATWVWLIPLLLVLGLGLPIIQGLMRVDSATPLDPTSAAPTGAKAVVETLRSHGVATSLARTLAEVQTAAVSGDPARATLVVHDPSSRLEPEQAQQLRELGFARIVFLGTAYSGDAVSGFGVVDTSGYAPPAPTAPPTPTATATPSPSETTTPGPATPAPATPEPPTPTVVEAGPRCEAELAGDAPAVTGTGGTLIELVGAAEATGWECYPVKDGYAAAGAPIGDGQQLAVIAWPNLLSNRLLADDANAALAIGVLGDEPSLVWYRPDSADAPWAQTGGQDVEVGELVPAWLTPAMLLLSASILALGLWRGRRLGPIVAERLPVVVRGSETLEGRARLYAASGSTLRAADSLRIGLLSRAARILALPRTMPAPELADAIAAAVGQPRERVRYLVLDANPRTADDLVGLSDDLLRLELALEATRPGAAPAASAASAPDPAPNPGPGQAAAAAAAEHHLTSPPIPSDDQAPAGREDGAPHAR